MSQRAGYLAAPLVAGSLIVLWLIAGVSIGDILKFLVFEALYVVLPGCLLYLLLGSDSLIPGQRLRVVAVGWPLGYALEIGAFSLTASLHARGAFTFLPVIALITLGPGARRRYRGARSRAAPVGAGLGNGSWGGRIWGVESVLGAAAITVALVLLAVRSFAMTPLPEHAGSVFYFVDNVWDISLAADALHHWPIAQSYLAGHPLRYYVGAFIHVAALKQVMGISIATTIFRLLPAASTVVAMLQFWCLGGLLGRSRWSGPITVALLLLVENMKLYPTHTKVFGVALFSEFTGSPTYGLGVVFLLGLLILCRVQLFGARADGSAAWTELRAARLLLLLSVLVLGGSAVKTTAVSTFVGGLGLFWLWKLVRGQRDRLLTCCVAVSLACFAAMYLLLLSGSGAPVAGEVHLAPLDFMKYTVFGSLVASHPAGVLLLGAAAVIVVWKVLPVMGLMWSLRGRGEFSSYAGFGLALFVVGFVVYVMVGSVNGNESYFAWYGYIPLISLATVTLVSVWGKAPAEVRRMIVRASLLTLLLGMLIAGITQALSTGGAMVGARRVLWYTAILVVACGLVTLWNLRLKHRLPSWQAPRGRRAAICGLLVFGVLGCAESIVLAVPDAWRATLDRQAVARDSPMHPGMTASLYRGLVWVRKHISSCDILAVSPPVIESARALSGYSDSEYFYYSAFAEREVFFESWVMSAEAQNVEQPYPALYALNEAATRGGNSAAVRELERRGVSYVLIDRTHHADARSPGSTGELVFSNSALEVYRLMGRVKARHC